MLLVIFFILCSPSTAMDVILLPLPTAGKQLLTSTERLVEINYFLFDLLSHTKPFESDLGQTLLQRLPGVGYVPP
jgi:hypothetical protein